MEIIAFSELIALLGMAWGIERILTVTSWFQIKEFRFDRMRSKIREDGWYTFFYLMPRSTPAQKARNLVTAGAAVILLGVGFWFSMQQLALWQQMLLLFATPFWAFFAVSIIVWLVNIPVRWYRAGKIRQAAELLRSFKVGQVVAITGSYGKTSVKELLYTVLSPDSGSDKKTKKTVMKTKANMNTDIGVALCLLQDLTTSTETVIAEIGAYRAGEAGAVAAFVQPSVVIVTAFGNQHIDLYGSKETLVAAESEPVSYLRPDGTAVINADIPEFAQVVRLMQPGQSLIAYSMSEPSSRLRQQIAQLHESVGLKQSVLYYANAVSSSSAGTKAHIHHPDGWFTIETPLLGQHSIQNLLPVIATAQYLGVSEKQLRSRLANVQPVLHKLSVHTGRGGTTVISDSLNANLHGFREGIHVLSSFDSLNKVIISRGIIELGSEKQRSYQMILSELALTDAVLMTTDPAFANLATGSAEKAGQTEERAGQDQVRVYDSLEQIRQTLLDDHWLTKDTTILLEGRLPEPFRDWVMGG